MSPPNQNQEQTLAGGALWTDTQRHQQGENHRPSWGWTTRGREPGVGVRYARGAKSGEHTGNRLPQALCQALQPGGSSSVI